MADELYLISGTTLTGIGDAIRQVTGKTSTIKVENFASELLNNSPVYHTVTFKGFDNEVLAEYKVKHGEGVVYTGKTPINSNVNRLFSYWDRDTSNITSDTIVSPNWEHNYVVQEYFTFANENLVYDCAVTGYIGGATAVIPLTNPDGRPVAKITGAIFNTTITSITIPSTCDDFKDSDFRQCSNLQDVYFLGSTYDWYYSIFCDGMTSSSTSRVGYFTNLRQAPRIHTSDGCIVNS